MKTTWKSNPDRDNVGKMPSYFTASNLCRIFLTGKGKPLDRSTVRKKARREKWRYTEATGLGGPENHYAFEDLPADLQMGIREYFGELPEPEDISEELRQVHEAQEWNKDLAQKREIVVNVLQGRLAEKEGSKTGKTKLVKQFAEEFNKQRVPGLGPEIYERVKHVKSRTLQTWLKNYKDKGLSGLLSLHRHNRGKTNIPPQQQQRIRQIMEKEPRWGARRIKTILRHEFPNQPVTTWAVRRFMAAEKEANPSFWNLCESRDKWKSKSQVALGNQSAKGEHFMHWVAIDSTKADVICNDGKRYMIIGVIDLYSRYAMVHVAPTSGSWAILALLWRLTEIGVPEHMVMDNGKEYRSKRLESALKRFGTTPHWVAPGTPEGKGTIERFLGILSHKCLEGAPGFVGHNVAEQQERRSRRRKSRGRRPAGSPDVGTEPIVIGLSKEGLQEYINRWLEEFHHREVHTGKGMGMSPYTKMSLSPRRPKVIKDPVVRTFYLAPCDTKIMQKDGLHFNSHIYYSPELLPWMNKQVMVYEDMSDAGRVYCADPIQAKPICIAEDLEILGTSPAFCQEQRQLQKKWNAAVKKELGLSGRYNAPNLLDAEIASVRAQGAPVLPLAVGEPMERNLCDDLADRHKKRRAAEQEESAQIAISEIEEEIFAIESDQYDEPKSGRPPLRLVGAAEDNKPGDLVFASTKSLLDYMLAKRRKGGLTIDDENRLRRTAKQWKGYAELSIDEWTRDDQEFLARIAPQYFGDYAENHAVGDSH